MSIKALLISVAVTMVTVGITFFYFRNRMNKTEQKVDLMFQLIQEHERNSRMAQQMQMQQMQPAMVSENNNNLINISDDEYDSDDSEVVSDNEDEDEDENKLVIDEQISEEPVDLEDTVKTISLSLDGAETSHTDSVNNNQSDELDELDEVALSENETDEADEDTVEVSDDGTLNNFVVTKKMTDDDDNDDDDESLDEQLSSENENEDENDEQQSDDNVEEVKTVVPEINYAKLSKNQLKQLAQEKGLAGYNKLTKGGLVDLLNATP